MNLQYRYTRHQVARGSKADAERGDAFYLIKNVSMLRLTYQIRLLAFRAKDLGRKLIIDVPLNCKIHASLRDFQKEHANIVRIQKV